MQKEAEIVEGSEELMELGVASEETRGGFAGYAWDGGLGKRWL